MRFKVSKPLLGFESIKEIKLEKIDDLFMKMSSIDDEMLSFTLVNPFALIEYDFELPASVSKELNATKDSNLLILNILLIQTPIEESLVNFLAPLIFNTDTNIVAQIILPEDTKYGVADKISTYFD